MNINFKTFGQKSTRFIFPHIGIVLAGMVLIFGIFMTETIKQSVIKNIYLKPDEYRLFINDLNYVENEKYYFNDLKNNFDVVIPFNNMNIMYNQKQTYVVGTNIEHEKLLIENRFYDINVTSYDRIHALPSIVYFKEIETYEMNSIIEVEGVSYEITGYFEFSDKETSYPNMHQIFVMDYVDFANQFPEYLGGTEGNPHYYFQSYYIKSNLTHVSTFDKIGELYQVALPWLYIESFTTILNKLSDGYSMFQGISVTFFSLVAVFLSINIIISVHLTIKERNKLYTVFVVLGMKLSHLRKMILKEIAVLSIYSTIVSLVLGMVIYGITLSTNNEFEFTWVPIEQLFISLCVIYLIPVIETIIATRFIKYRSITNSDL